MITAKKKNSFRADENVHMLTDKKMVANKQKKNVHRKIYLTEQEKLKMNEPWDNRSPLINMHFF